MVVDGIDDYLLPYAVKIEAILLLFYNTQDKPLKKKKSKLKPINQKMGKKERSIL